MCLWPGIDFTYRGVVGKKTDASLEPFQHTSRKKDSTDMGMERQKNSGSATGN